uniref:hypothetical protein n=1 Tax=Pedobacter schmidteae TaxID=2201271 RepID=UPI000EB58566|nr:hypothetical protein [Pedobacter schmidteae]
MDNNLENNDWKKEAPLLATLPVSHPFSVPEGYFENLSLQLTDSIYLEKLKNEIPAPGFEVPDNYFNDLQQQISSEILANRLKTVAPVGDYAVPAHYFEQLQAKIQSKTIGEQKQQTAKIVRLWRSKVVKYASAACFVMLSAIGIYFYEQQHHNNKLAYTEQNADQMLYDIDEQVIIDHIESNDLQQVKPGATDVALENYILTNYTQSDIARNL